MERRQYPALHSLPCSRWGAMEREVSMAEERQEEALQGPAEARSLSHTVWPFWSLKSLYNEKVSPWLAIDTVVSGGWKSGEVAQPSFPWPWSGPSLLCWGQGYHPPTHTHITKPIGKLRVAMSGLGVPQMNHLLRGKEAIFNEHALFYSSSTRHLAGTSQMFVDLSGINRI